MSREVSVFIKSSAKLSQFSLLEASKERTMYLSLRSPSSSLALSSLSSFRATAITVQEYFLISVKAIALPMPEDAPVITAVLFLKSYLIVIPLIIEKILLSDTCVFAKSSKVNAIGKIFFKCALHPHINGERLGLIKAEKKGAGCHL